MMRKGWEFAGAVLLLSMALVFGFLAETGTVRAAVSADQTKEEYVFSMQGENFRILQLSDIQLAELGERRRAFPIVRELVRRAAPDLIVLTGDNLHDGATLDVLESLVELMDRFCIPWASVPGNHERGIAFPEGEYISALEQSRYCVFARGGLQGRYGNYTCTLKKGERRVFSLIFMDSGVSGFSAEQVAWYEQRATGIPNACFFHIPIPQVVLAHERYAADPTIGSGEQRERVDAQEESGFFEALQRAGSTVALFYGHDHINNTILNYEGVLFCYALKSGRTCYWNDDMLGGNLITVDESGALTVERIFVRG